MEDAEFESNQEVFDLGLDQRICPLDFSKINSLSLFFLFLLFILIIFYLAILRRQRYAHSNFNPTILQFFNSPSYGAYTTFATETAILAITVAKSPFFLPKYVF